MQIHWCNLTHFPSISIYFVYIQMYWEWDRMKILPKKEIHGIVKKKKKKKGLYLIIISKHIPNENG